MKIQIDTQENRVVVDYGNGTRTLSLSSAEAFDAISQVWLRCGWDTKYVYSFTWLGRPVIQLPEDMLRIQEVIYKIKPDVIVETGIAHGGSLIFYAGLCKTMSKGRVIGIDIEVRPHNRKAIESHELFEFITLIEGSSTSPDIVSQVGKLVLPGETVLVLLDSNHSREHVLNELRAYASLVSVGSCIVVCDGIMARLENAPRTHQDWTWNNPLSAIQEFVAENQNFVVYEPSFPFNEGIVENRVTYCPNGFLRRVS